MAMTRGTARRYGEAAFQIAERDDAMEAWLSAFRVAGERLTDPAVTRLLANPAVPSAARVEVLERLLGEEVSGPPRNLLILLVQRGRFEQLPAVHREFLRLYRRREGIVEAAVTSAVPLEAREQKALQQRLEAMTGSQVEMDLEVDPGLLGGIQVRLGDRLIDGSVRGRLERMRAAFATQAI